MQKNAFLQINLAWLPERLLPWYDKNKRDLPWRKDPTPYRVWVSEIMLQQTRVEAVRPYYERFMQALPDVTALARAEEDKLMKLWEGLGYYSRARNLKKAAQAVVLQYSGELPQSRQELLALPGIGEYTAGAICSIAFGQPVAAVDGNVLRVMARVLADGRDMRAQAVKREVAVRLEAVYPPGRCSSFTQSLMELGATVCLPGEGAKCSVCPLRKHCLAGERGCAATFPVAAEKKPRRVEKRTVFVIVRQGRVALRKRPGTGLLAGLWELPGAVGHLTQDQAKEALSALGVETEKISPAAEARHVFSHVQWDMKGYLVAARREVGAFVWATGPELAGRYALASAFAAYRQLALNAIQERAPSEGQTERLEL